MIDVKLKRGTSGAVAVYWPDWEKFMETMPGLVPWQRYFSPGDRHHRYLEALSHAQEAPQDHPLWQRIDDDTHELAFLLDTPAEEFLTKLGWQWQRHRQPVRMEYDDRRWYLAGSPLQVVIGVSYDDVLVAVPEIVWTPGPSLGIAEELARLPHAVSPELIAAVERAQATRRATFLYCSRCRNIKAPENVERGNICHACMTDLMNVSSDNPEQTMANESAAAYPPKICRLPSGQGIGPNRPTFRYFL